MKYYSEQEMKSLRLRFEEKVLLWSQVSTRKMFGCPCYQVNGKLFAFLVTSGVVITQLDQNDRAALSRQCQAAFFQAGEKIVKNWLMLSIKNQRDLNQIMPFVRKSYEAALQKNRC